MVREALVQDTSMEELACKDFDHVDGRILVDCLKGPFQAPCSVI
jgi:hypothetical protein